ncbi:hypothetical protein CR513_10454, partial [Mucuna pruriens]
MVSFEIGEPSPRAIFFQLGVNEEELRANLDLLQEGREITHVREYAPKAKASRRYNARVFPRKLQKILKDATSSKLTLNCEGPYRIVEEVGRGHIG